MDIIVCSNNRKNKLLRENKTLSNNKYYTLNEFIKNLYFDYDCHAILYVMHKYDVDYDIAEYYLKNLIYIEDKNYNNEKLDFLVNLKKDLLSNNLLIINNNFKKVINQNNVIIYDSLNKFDKYLLRDINYTIEEDSNENYIPNIYEFNNIEDEVEYIAYSISNLINSGIDINKIKLTNIDDEYVLLINEIFDFYNLKIDKYINEPIISNIVGNTFYSNLKLGIDKALDSIKCYEGLDTYNKIIDIINKYVWCTNSDDLYILIEHDLHNTYIKHDIYKNSIEVVDLLSYDFTDEYVFMLSFNQNIIPKTYKDEDYITDSIKPSYMDNTNDKNIFEKEKVLRKIKNIKNLVITYKLNTNFNSYYKSNLVDELVDEIKIIKLDYTNSYCPNYNKLKLSMMLDNLIKFGEQDENLSLLYSNYDIPYNTYNHKFTGVKKELINELIKSRDKFNLSYSSMDDYNRCAFKFYIEKILNLKNNMDKFSVILGNIYHDALEHGVKEEIDVSEVVYKFISDNEIELTNSTRFFVEKAIENIKYVLDTIKKHNSFSKLNEVETEKYVNINIKDNINFVGFIDKIVYKMYEDYIIASIIDYKTYVKKPSLRYLDYGIGLQLPTYMYLAKHAYKNVRFAGFYLQNITLDNKSTDEKEKSLKLIGYTNSNPSIIEQFDSSYKDSVVIDSMKVNKDGSFSSNSLKYMMSNEQIDDIINTTENKINELIDNILSAKFDINPKYDNGNIGCEFCTFKDICYMKDVDLLKLDIKDGE